MTKAHKPRSGSMQYWPRKRSKRPYPRVRCWTPSNEVKPLGFAGYKVGMTHITFTDNKPNSMTKGKEISMPATIIECPPIKTASIIFYKKTDKGIQPSSALMASNLDKELKRKIALPKAAKKKIEDFKAEEYDDIKMLVYTQPKLTTIGKKKPELFELALGGKIEEKLNWAKENLGKDISLTDVLSEGQLIDAHAITTGKGTVGPMKRMGISRTSHKSEKGVRTPANLGAWTGARQYRVAKAGQLGFLQRTEMNKWIIKIGDKPEDVNKKAGFRSYGLIKNQYIMVKGSIPGPKKRLILMVNPLRPNKKLQVEAPILNYINK